ncbi:hypothetical protein MUO14_23595 [Halobacillus shinanisalinarum]|uniref:Uncharacterized protein n=1 Tax=Halobacillus shinanisalinarum TaxID=2932258 RepID=A0ABY4GZF4_9BACI|nr:hypothetical protein [Halobacillus shinanisalinarum]UOQ93321.1 hypothetical protein MUO14_23595 [Halobacillus shinanisalinarum]
MKRWLSDRLFILYSVLLLVYLIHVFLDLSYLEWTVGILAVPILLLSFYYATRLFQVLGCLFLTTGNFMLISSDIPVHNFPLYLISNMNLLIFLSMLPWINSAAYIGRYEKSIKKLMKVNVRNLGDLYPKSVLTSGTLMTFLNLSAVNLSQEMLINSLKSIKKRIRDRLIARSTIRAYALTMIWSPMEIMVGIVVDATGVSYLSYLPWLLLVSFTVLLIDFQLQKRSFRSIPYREQGKAHRYQATKEIYLKMFKLLMILGMFLAVVMLASQWLRLSFILAVTLVIFPFSFVWAFFMKKTSLFLRMGYKSWRQKTNQLQNFVVLFISLSLFSNSLNQTAALSWIQYPFTVFKEYPVVILVLILFTYISLGLLGVHPIATVGVLLEILRPFFEIFNPIGIGVMLIVGALATASSGTYGVVVTMTSINTRQNPYAITVTNLPFTLIFGSIGIAVSYILL